jgi:hypothetical protein
MVTSKMHNSYRDFNLKNEICENCSLLSHYHSMLAAKSIRIKHSIKSAREDINGEIMKIVKNIN